MKPSLWERIPLRALTKDMLTVSGLTLGAQAITGLAQLFFATMFGASVGTDAYFAALSAPLYLTAVIVPSLSVVFVPIYLEHRTKDAAEADALASNVVNVAAVGLLLLAVGGVVLADPIIGLTAPGLTDAGRRLARELAIVLWPSIVGAGLVNLLTALWQVRSRFGRSAVIPFIGAVVNLGLFFLLGPIFGVWGAAIAWTVSLLLQAALLAPVLRGFWRPSLGLGHPALRALFAGVAPLAAAAVFIRAGTLLERYLGSELPPGQLSQLTYASRIVAILCVLVSAGPAAVLFPQMAEDVSLADLSGLRSRAARSLRSLWLLVAPLTALLIGLADPGIRVVLEYGVFTRADSEQVALLTRIYAPIILVTALATVSGRAIYALKAVRLLSILGAIEGLAYIVYTTVLAQRFGAIGIALGSTIYVGGSLVWQLIFLRRRLTAHGAGLGGSLLQSGAVAALAGLVAWVVSGLVSAPLAAVLLGGGAGLATYLGGLGTLAAVRRLGQGRVE